MVFAVGGGRAVDCCKTMADQNGQTRFHFPDHCIQLRCLHRYLRYV